ncbi:MAG: YfhO family protein [Gemmatimonadaceae bacterium]|nr:YfhO family protein [Gemmatimonadaceae bacterium]
MEEDRKKENDDESSVAVAERPPTSTSGEPAPPPFPPITREMVADSGPSRPGLWAAVLYALCTLALGYPAIAGKFLAGPNSDQFVAGYAFREYGASILKATGGFAQWNPYLFGGMPYIAAMHGDIFYPTFLLRMVMPTDAAMTWSFIMHLFLAGWFTYYFLRASGFGFYSALFGGVAYMMSGQLASLVSPGHDGKLSVSALFPLTLWMLTLGMHRGRRWSWGVLALAVGLAVLSPHPQLLQYLLLASGAFTLHLSVSLLRSRDIPARTVAARMGLALLAVAIGLAIGAIQYLPVREYVAWSPRAGGLADYAVATSYAWPLRELFDAYLPQFTGMIEAYWGENAIHLHTDYIGAVVLVLAGAAFTRLRRDPRRGFVMFWSVTFVIALLWALGGHTPFYRIPYAIIPGTKYFRAPATVFFVGTMALSVLSATGVERVLTRAISLKYAFGWLAFAGIVVALGSTGVLTDFAQALAPDEMVDSVIANSLEVILGAWRSFAFVLLPVGVILLHRRGRLTLGAVGWSLAILAAADSWTIMRHYWVFSPPASITYRADAAIERVKRDPQPARVLAIELEPNGRRDTNLQGDGLMIHRVRTVLGYHGNQLGRYNELLDKQRGFIQIFNPRIWQLLNMRYLLTNTADVGRFFPGAEWIIGPVKDAAGTNVYLYRLPGENPYAWVAPVIVKADDPSVSATLLNQAFDLRTAALFAPDANVRGVEHLGALPPASAVSASVTRYAPGRVSLELNAPAPRGSALMVSENYFPGWTATVDGKPATVGRADYTITGVELPEGGRKIELSFSDVAYEQGKLITILALLAAAGLIAGGILREREAID